MRRKQPRFFIAIIFLLGPLLAQAKVVLVVSANAPQYLEIAASFKQTFSGTLEDYNLKGLEDEVRKQGKTLAANPPDLLIVVGNLAANMAREYCPNCPVVYVSASNAAGLKFSGTNIYGVSAFPSAAKIVENLKLVFPDRRRIGIVYKPEYVGREIKELQTEAAKAGLALQAVPISDMKQMPAELANLLTTIDIYLILDDPGVITADTFPYIFMNCFSKKVPIFATRQDMVKNGAIAGFVPDNSDAGLEAGQLANQFFQQKGGPGKLVYPDGRLYLNSKIAGALNLIFTPAIKSQGVAIE